MVEEVRACADENKGVLDKKTSLRKDLEKKTTLGFGGIQSCFSL